MASVLRSEDHLHGSQPIASAGELHQRTPLELASLLRSDSPPESAVGLAAANALLGPTAENLRDEKAVAILRERGRGRKVAMIGRFPFADTLREDCDQLWVFERGLNRRQEDFGEEAMEQLLPQADVVAVTATTLLNQNSTDRSRRGSHGCLCDAPRAEHSADAGAVSVRLRRPLRHSSRRP